MMTTRGATIALFLSACSAVPAAAQVTRVDIESRGPLAPPSTTSRKVLPDRTK